MRKKKFVEKFETTPWVLYSCIISVDNYQNIVGIFETSESVFILVLLFTPSKFPQVFPVEIINFRKMTTAKSFYFLLVWKLRISLSYRKSKFVINRYRIFLNHLLLEIIGDENGSEIRKKLSTGKLDLFKLG